MRRFLLLLLFAPPLLLGVTCASFTSNKLHKMRQIRGQAPGATVERQVVTGRWEQPHPDGMGVARWIAWNGHDVRRPGSERVSVTREIFEATHVGDTIEIVHVSGDSSPYLRGGIFAGDGNMRFDQTLLVIELIFTGICVLGAGIMALVLARSRVKANVSSTPT